MKIEIKVTRNDIRLGERWSCRECPIALAIRRDLGLLPNVCGAGIELQGVLGNVLLTAACPAEANDFIGDFDSGFKVKPLTFTLDIPAKMLKRIQGAK